jgi:hypothetical protein
MRESLLDGELPDRQAPSMLRGTGRRRIGHEAAGGSFPFMLDVNNGFTERYSAGVKPDRALASTQGKVRRSPGDIEKRHAQTTGVPAMSGSLLIAARNPARRLQREKHRAGKLLCRLRPVPFLFPFLPYPPHKKALPYRRAFSGTCCKNGQCLFIFDQSLYIASMTA